MVIPRDKAKRWMEKSGQSEAQIAKQLGSVLAGSAPSKYRNKRTQSDIIGRTFHSDAERRYAEVLYAKEQAGDISGLTFQVHIKLLGVVAMRPDFYYLEGGEPIWNEFKGFATDTWRMQRRIWEVCGPGHYRVTKEVKNGYAHDDIYPSPSDAMIQVVLKYLLRENNDGTA